MKTRAVVVWFERPVYVHGRGKRARTQLDLLVVVQEPAAAAAERFLGGLGHEVLEETQHGELASAIRVGMQAMQTAMPLTPGLRWVGECAEFQLQDGSLCVIPRDLIAWIELGPEVDG
jgi:hypothetical protein